MKVKMLTGMAGRDYSLSPGDEHECSDAEAARLIAAGFAEPLAPKKAKSAKPEIETAVVVEEVETRG